MREKITDRLVVEERVCTNTGTYYTKYRPSFFIDDEQFATAIENMGGHVYNKSVGKVAPTKSYPIGSVTIFNGFTWLSVCDAPSHKDCDMWAKQFESALFEIIGSISPIHIHHPDPGLHTWGIEFNRDKNFWEASANEFVAAARKILGSGWFHQSGADHSKTGYQLFELLNPAEDSLFNFEAEEYVARGRATQIAKEIGSIMMF